MNSSLLFTVCCGVLHAVSCVLIMPRVKTDVSIYFSRALLSWADPSFARALRRRKMASREGKMTSHDKNIPKAVR